MSGKFASHSANKEFLFSCDSREAKGEATAAVAASLGTGNFKNSTDMPSYSATAAAASLNSLGGGKKKTELSPQFDRSTTFKK